MKLIILRYYSQNYHLLGVFLTINPRYKLFFYNLFIFFYGKLIYIYSFFNKKAAAWINGRKHFPDLHSVEKTIWMHCASLGEFEQGRPLIEKLKIDFPNYPIVVSFFSPSGYEIRKDYPVANKIIYLPLDTASNAKKIIKQINPALAIWVKYEFWMNCLNELKNQQIPVILIAGIFRKNQPFFKAYGGIWKKVLSAFEHLFVQNQNALQLLNEVNIHNISVCGDTRFDRVIEIAEQSNPVPLIKAFKNNHTLLIAGSTWEEDEKILSTYSQENPELKLVIVPHEIQQQNLNRIKRNFKNAILYSEWKKNDQKEIKTDVIIVDSIGLLSSLYKYADITYIGGGFNKGIHNTLEAAVYGKPVLFGPRYHKFEEAKGLIENNAGISINDFTSLKSALDSLLADRKILLKTGENAQRYVYENKGATEKIINYIKLKRLLIN